MEGVNPKDKVTHEIGTDQVEFNSVYRDAYRAELELVSASWDSMTDEERLQHLNAAHSAGNKAAKQWYLDTYVNTDTE